MKPGRHRWSTRGMGAPTPVTAVVRSDEVNSSVRCLHHSSPAERASSARTSRSIACNAGHQVVVLDDLSGGFRDHVPEGALFVEGSITDEALVARLFDQYEFDYVYHLAAYAAEGLSHFIRRVQLHEQRHRQHRPDQRGGEARSEVLRLHVVDRGLRRRAACR